MNVYKGSVFYYSLGYNRTSLPVDPFFFGGYSVIVNKDSVNYCKECNYIIEFKAENDIVNISLLLRTSNSLTKLKKNMPTLGMTTAGKRSCYLYFLPKDNQDQNIIITSNVYSGNASLYIKPWSLPENKSNFLTSYNLDDFEVTKLQPFARNILQQSYGDIFFCIYAEKTSSYFLNVFLEDEVEKNQVTNTLIPGKFIFKFRSNICRVSPR